MSEEETLRGLIKSVGIIKGHHESAKTKISDMSSNCRDAYEKLLSAYGSLIDNYKLSGENKWQNDLDLLIDNLWSEYNVSISMINELQTLITEEQGQIEGYEDELADLE